ncbi:MAG TPA: TonB-dependent receptor [Candidatus Limnocylindrales bacterium]|nr:TonB-dependent receptor [Candidatus Limnocylindrales bacterium]
MSRYVLAAALFGVLTSAFAQTQAINGSIRGRVTDAGSGAIPNANVSIVNNATDFTRKLVTNDEGYFVFPNLPLGTYAVTVQHEGFDTQRHTGVTIDAGTEAVLDVVLKVGAVTTTVEVTGSASVIEPSRVSTGRTIDHVEVDNLPLTSRNPYNFVIFQPGVSGHPNPELGIPRTINTNGLLDRINYQMDGMVNTETDRYGLRLFPISDIYVREVQTVSNSFAPEFGGTSGNIFNVITNSGTNQFHGEFSFIGRPTDASARTILLAANKVPPVIDLHDYAVNAGGPIVKDKLFIFGGYEHLLRGLPSPNTINQSSAAQLGLAPSLLDTAPAVQHAQFLNLRADWVITQKHQFFVRYNYFRNEYPFNTAVGGTNALDVAEDFHDRSHIAGLQLLSSFTPTVLNEFRASWPYRNEAHVASPGDGPGPTVVVTGVATFNGYGPDFKGDKFAEKIPSLSDGITVIRGSHTMKYGLGWQENNDNQVGPVTNRYTFPTIASYLAAKSGANPFGYTSYATVLGVPGVAYKSNFLDFYAQDSWQLRPNFLLIYGVRYDYFRSPDGEANAPFVYTRSFHNPTKNFAPRLGFAWSLDQRTVVRASTGIFFEAPPTNLWYNALNNDGSTRSFSTSLSSTSAGAPAFPTVLAFIPGAAPITPSITATTPDFRNAYTFNSSLQITHQLTNSDALTLGYVHTAGREQGFLRNMNLINPVSFLADGRPVFSAAINANTRLFPQFNAITLQDSGAISDYNAMILHWRHQMGLNYLVDLSYTWSHSISDAPDANSFEQNALIEDPTNRTRDRGNSLVNRPSALLFSTVMTPHFKVENAVLKHILNGNLISLLGNISSGDQQNITAASPSPLNGDSTTTGQRPLYVGRDTVRGPNVYQVDGRYTRTLFTIHEHISPKIIVEANNIFNHKNITSLVTSATTNQAGIITAPPTFLPNSTVLEARILQLGIRLDW